MRTAFFRGIVFALGFLTTMIVWLGGITYAASGGLFGEILMKVLGVADITTYTGDGTVKNAQKLGGVDAANYQRALPGQSCAAPKCVAGFDTSNNVICR